MCARRPDLPTDLPERLVAAGFAAGEPATVLQGSLELDQLEGTLDHITCGVPAAVSS